MMEWTNDQEILKFKSRFVSEFAGQDSSLPESVRESEYEVLAFSEFEAWTWRWTSMIPSRCPPNSDWYNKYRINLREVKIVDKYLHVS